MALSENDVRLGIRRLLLSRMRILCTNGFYGLLLMHMTYNLDEGCTTAATDGQRIYFSPDFLRTLSDSELDFVMMHEIMHVVLQHCLRTGDRDPELFNIACDIVVNSNILLSCGMDTGAITLREWGESMHIAPDGKEGHLYTAEEVYDMLASSQKNKKRGGGNRKAVGGGRKGKGSDSGNSDSGKENSRGRLAHGSGGSENTYPYTGWDDHTRWGTVDDDGLLRDLWVKRFEDACEAVSIRDPSNQRGMLPAFAERMFKDMRSERIDWRSVLNDFVQEEIVDYSFAPPDRRFDGGDFYMPDFNDTELSVKDILFMIDASGSMSDEMISEAYAEIKSAVDQFGGKLRGWLGFFDAAIIEPKPFADMNELKKIRPAGGGGTDLGIIFKYVDRFMNDTPPVSIIILTDGYAPFPKESEAHGVPVLWLINNKSVDPPWGKVARICD